jgi:hypothetical protein
MTDDFDHPAMQGLTERPTPAGWLPCCGHARFLRVMDSSDVWCFDCGALRPGPRASFGGEGDLEPPADEVAWGLLGALALALLVAVVAWWTR